MRGVVQKMLSQLSRPVIYIYNVRFLSMLRNIISDMSPVRILKFLWMEKIPIVLKNSLIFGIPKTFEFLMTISFFLNVLIVKYSQIVVTINSCTTPEK